MKKISMTKRVIAFALSILMAFSAVSVAVVEPLAAGEHQHIFDAKWEIAVAPTCVAEGSRYRQCTVDGCTYRVYDTIPININNHNYQQTEVKIQATCKVTGIEIYTCLWCEKETYKYIEKLPHTFDEDKWQITTTAKCNKPGREKNDCTVCGSRIAREYTVEHDVDDSKILVYEAPTCKTKGVICYDCRTCTDLVKVEVEVDADNHVFTENPFDISGLTCKTDGIGKVVCKECGVTKTVTVGKENAHSYLEWTVKTPLPADADCMTSGAVGVRVRYCDICNTNTAMESFYPQHKLATGYSTRLSTCMKSGYNRGDCLICMETGVDVTLPIDEDAHLWKEVVLEEATCANKGRLLRICTLNDGHVDEVDIPKLEHTVTDNWLVIEPTCTEEGCRINNCTECGEVYEIIPIDSEAHVFADDVVWVQDPQNKPTCFSEGEEMAMCQKCFKTIRRPVPKHYNTRIVYSYTAPTCFTEGKIEYACTACSSGQVLSDILPIDPDAHVKRTVKSPVILPTCYSAGLRAYDCIYCDYYFAGEDDGAEAIETTAHTMSGWEITKRPTCEENGVKTRKCTNENCNHTESRVMSATHNFTTWRVLVEATCSQQGTRSRNCYTCNTTEYDTYMGTHAPGVWEFVDSSQNCTTGGKVRLKCSICSKYYDEKTVAAGEHVELNLLEKVYKHNETSCYSEVYECTVCKVQVKNILPHMWMETQAAIAPDCVTAGITEAKYCPICFYDSPAKIIEPLGHNFKYDDNGTKYCTRCNIYDVELEDGSRAECTHFCHNNGIVTKVLAKILAFFWKILGINQTCECGAPHYVIEEKVK